MPAERWRQLLYRVALTAFVIGAIVYSVVSVWRGVRAPRTSEKDEITLVCAKCDGEAVLPSAEFRKLRSDPATSAFQCPKCGALAARIATVRCPKCQRAIPPQPRDAPLACPFCKAPFITPDTAEGK